MSRSRPLAPHPDDLVTAVAHFNASFRTRYRLPPTTLEAVREVQWLSEALGDLPAVRAGGVADASCALIARYVLSTLPRYGIGFLDASGKVVVLQPYTADDQVFRSHHVLLVNPLGGYENWSSVARWVRRVGGDQARRLELADLAVEWRPDEEANFALLNDAAPDHGHGIVLPPDEAFSSRRAAEVSYIYGIPVETLRAWKLKYLKDRAAKRPGRPSKNR